MFCIVALCGWLTDDTSGGGSKAAGEAANSESSRHLLEICAILPHDPRFYALKAIVFPSMVYAHASPTPPVTARAFAWQCFLGLSDCGELPPFWARISTTHAPLPTRLHDADKV